MEVLMVCVVLVYPDPLCPLHLSNTELVFSCYYSFSSPSLNPQAMSSLCLDSRLIFITEVH